jgi:hypothetical protein
MTKDPQKPRLDKKAIVIAAMVVLILALLIRVLRLEYVRPASPATQPLIPDKGKK